MQIPLFYLSLRTSMVWIASLASNWFVRSFKHVNIKLAVCQIQNVNLVFIARDRIPGGDHTWTNVSCENAWLYLDHNTLVDNFEHPHWTHSVCPLTRDIDIICCKGLTMRFTVTADYCQREAPNASWCKRLHCACCEHLLIVAEP